MFVSKYSPLYKLYLFSHWVQLFIQEMLTPCTSIALCWWYKNVRCFSYSKKTLTTFKVIFRGGDVHACWKIPLGVVPAIIGRWPETFPDLGDWDTLKIIWIFEGLVERRHPRPYSILLQWPMPAISWTGYSWMNRCRIHTSMCRMCVFVP